MLVPSFAFEMERLNLIELKVIVRVPHAITDSASPRPKMYWTRTCEELVPSLDTTSNRPSNQVTSFYLFSGKLEYPNKIIRFNTSIVRMQMNPCEEICRR